MQFIRRILSEVGIYWRTEMDNTRELDTYIFADGQLNYRFDVRLPYSEPSGLFDGAAESVWDVRTWHNIATGIVATRDYNYRTQIQEFKYCGVSFDGWKDKLCQFWEAKARYDQFFDAFGDPKGWWKGYKSGLSQAARHQAVATVNQPLKIVWIFMQPISYRYFSKMFKDFKDIITRWMP